MRKIRIPLLMSAFTLTIALTIILTSAFTVPAPHALLRESCSCTAPDGTCSVSVTCRGGCTQFCGNNNNCYANCSVTSEDLGEGLGAEITLPSQSISYSELVAKSSRASGIDIRFFGERPNEVVKVSFKKATVWDVLELLSKRGTVQVGLQDFDRLKSLRKILLYDERVSYCAKDTRVRTVVNELSGLTGLPLRITKGNPMTRVNVCLQPAATLREIISDVSAQSGVKIEEVNAGAGRR